MKIYLVGGAVRDKLLHLPIKERDYVVVGASIQDMLDKGFKQVGKDFPVFIHPKTGEEYALARMERKIKPGYSGFTFDTSPYVTLEEDLKRRDLTINAMAIALDTKELVDPYHGQKDLYKKILRHVSEAFSEDPVRILRLARFLARYHHMGFKIAKETLALMKKMVKNGEVDALVAERVWKELERALTEKNPEKFFESLAACKALSTLFPYLNIKGPGIKALKKAAKLSSSPLVRFAALLHAQPEMRKKSHDKDSTKKAIAELCQRYRVPTQFKELAQLTALHYKEALKAKKLTADAILKLLNALDIYRREPRFIDFLNACTAIAASKRKKFAANWFKNAAKVAKSVNVQELIAQGFVDRALATKLNEMRLKKIDNWLKKN